MAQAKERIEQKTTNIEPLKHLAPIITLGAEDTIRGEISQTIKVLSWNINGIRARMKKNDFFEQLKRENADICCFQEVRCHMDVFLRKKNAIQSLKELGYKHIVYAETQGNAGYAGVAIFSKIKMKSFLEGVNDVKLDKEGRALFVEFENFWLVNVYTPNSGDIESLESLDKRLKFDEKFNQRCNNITDKPMLCVGDRNVAYREDSVWGGLASKRWNRHPACTKEERDMFAQNIAAKNWISLQEKFGKKGFTFFHRPWDRKADKGMLLDYSLCTNDFAEKYVRDFSLVKNLDGSDHVAQKITLEVELFSHSELELGAEETNSDIPDLDINSILEPKLPFVDIEDLQEIEHFANLCIENPEQIEDSEPSFSARPAIRIHRSLGGYIGADQVSKYDPSGTGLVEGPYIEEFLNPSDDFVESNQYECISNTSETNSRKKVILPVTDVHFKGRKLNTLKVLWDSGASSSVADKAWIKKLLSREYGTVLDKSGHLPRFSVADKSVISPEGSVELTFFIGDSEFKWSFFVLESCAHPLIIGNDFMAAHFVSLDYLLGKITVHDQNLQSHESVPFELHRSSQRFFPSHVLYAAEDLIIDPWTAKLTDVTAPTLRNLERKPWGFCTEHKKSRIKLPNSSITIEGGKSQILACNLQNSDTIRIRKGQPIAIFIEDDRQKYDAYLVNLENLGTEQDFLIDFDEFYSKSTEAIAKNEHSTNIENITFTNTTTYKQQEPILDKNEFPMTDSDIVKDKHTTIFKPHSQTTLSSVSPNSVITNLREEISPSSKLATLGEDVDNSPNPGLATLRSEIKSSSGVVNLSKINSPEFAHPRGKNLPGSRLVTQGQAEISESVTEICKHCKAFDKELCTCIEQTCHIQNSKPLKNTEESDMHLERLPKELTEKLSNEEILEYFKEGPLSNITIGDHLTEQQVRELRLFLLQNRDIFAKNDKHPGKAKHFGCKIDTGDAKPQAVPLRSTLPNVRPIIDKKLDELLKFGIIEHSTSPWAAAILLVPKRDGDVRVCLDYRNCNKVTIKDGFSLPRVDDCLASLEGNKYFTVCDLNQSFYQIPMATEEDKQKTAFRTHRGHFQFTRMPMGLVNAPAT